MTTLGLNYELRSDKPAMNSLRYGTVYLQCLNSRGYKTFTLSGERKQNQQLLAPHNQECNIKPAAFGQFSNSPRLTVSRDSVKITCIIRNVTNV